MVAVRASKSDSRNRQCTRTQMLTETEIRGIKPLRQSRKFSDGGGLYLLIHSSGGRYWRYNYRFNGKQKTLALGIYPDVSLANARTRHQAARCQLAAGIDPSTCRRELRSRLAGSDRCPIGQL